VRYAPHQQREEPGDQRHRERLRSDAERARH
jgi:hypothetical protein